MVENLWWWLMIGGYTMLYYVIIYLLSESAPQSTWKPVAGEMSVLVTSEGPESAALRMDYVRFCTDSPSMAILPFPRHDSQTGLNSEFRSHPSVFWSRGNSFCKRDISETFSVFSIPQTFDHEKLPLGSLGKNDSLININLATATSSNDLFPFSSFFQAASPCRRSSPSKCVGSAWAGPVQWASPCNPGDLAGLCRCRVAKHSDEAAEFLPKKRLVLQGPVPDTEWNGTGGLVWPKQPEEIFSVAPWGPSKWLCRTATVSLCRSNRWHFCRNGSRVRGDCLGSWGAGQHHQLDSTVWSSAGRRRFRQSPASFIRQRLRGSEELPPKSQGARQHEDRNQHFASTEPSQHHQSLAAWACLGSRPRSPTSIHDGLGQVFRRCFAGNRLAQQGSGRGCAERCGLCTATSSCCWLGSHGCEAGKLAGDQQVHGARWGNSTPTPADWCRRGWKARERPSEILHQELCASTPGRGSSRN